MREDIKNRLTCAARQFRHNSDNSPDVFNPRDGFVIAYDREEVDELIGDLLSEMEAARAQQGEGREADPANVWLPFGAGSAYADAKEAGKTNMTISCELVVELIDEIYRLNAIPPADVPEGKCQSKALSVIAELRNQEYPTFEFDRGVSKAIREIEKAFGLTQGPAETDMGGEK